MARYLGGVQLSAWSPDRGEVASAFTALASPLLVTASTALLLTGCAGTDDVTARIASPHQADVLAGATEPGAAMSAPGGLGPGNVAVSPRQRGYLDALAAAGVQRSSDLRALSIGSYVCQGRAARQSNQAVWDFVYPLVRNDINEVADAHLAGEDALLSPKDATARYIDIATDRLC